MDNKLIIAIIVLILVVVAGVFVARMDTGIDPVEVNMEEAEAVAEEWMMSNSPTYTFDGSSLEIISSEQVNGSAEVTFYFESAAAGYGDRSDEMVAQVITEHETVVTVEDGEVVSVVTDGVFDEMNREMIDETTEQATVVVDVYFVFVEDGEESISPVEREVDAETADVDALSYLLEGPTDEEVAEGYSTAIDEETELIGLDVHDTGVAHVNFTSELEVAGGSAWVIMIREQITETLMQFDWIDEVIIFIEGEDEGVLQP